MSDVTLRMLLLGEDKTASSSLKHVGDAADSTGKKLSSVGQIAKGVFAGNLVTSGFSQAFNFAKTAVFGFNSTLEQSTIAFTTMLGSGTKAKVFLAQLQQFAKVTPFEFQGLVQNSQTLMGMGVAA